MKSYCYLLFWFVFLCSAAQAELLKDPVSWKKSVVGRGHETVIYTNNSSVPVTLRLTARAKNMRCSHKLPHLLVISPGERSEGISFIIKDPELAWSYQFDYLYQFGDYRIQMAESAYPLPFRGRAECIQAFQGEFSHKGPQSYSLDFDLGEGTPILASRDGLVVRLEEKFSRAGTTPDFLKKGNFVCIAHSDGTVSRYYHLRVQGVSVELGDKIKAGQLIGYSGNTGFSDGPHLHFDVSVPGSNKDLTTRTVPFRIRHRDKDVEPREDAWYEGGYR